jgi:hypothetical protein
LKVSGKTTGEARADHTQASHGEDAILRCEIFPIDSGNALNFAPSPTLLCAASTFKGFWSECPAGGLQKIVEGENPIIRGLKDQFFA